MLSRHGTRLPTSYEMNKLRDLMEVRDQILNNYNTRKTKPDTGALCDRDLEQFEEWKWDDNVTELYDQFLTTQGWNDLKFLGIHYQKIFYDLIGSVYNSQEFLFRHTNTQRTQASYKAFAEGFFGPGAFNNINLPSPPSNDTLLRPYDSCPTWKKTEADQKELKKFQESSIYIKMLSDVSLRLGFQYNLTVEQVNTMYDMCRYEQAWYLDNISTWCAAFTPDQVKILEYASDLKYYYKTGYGNGINSNIPCELMSDMVKQLESTSNPTTIAYFSHSAMLQTFLVALGVGKDNEALRSDNFEQMSQRNWRTSDLSPFSGNLAAVKYECPQDTNEKYKVMFFLNQKYVSLDWCNVGLCNLSDVKRKLKKYTESDCSKTFCDESSSNLLKSSLSLIFISFFFVFSKF